ncbi:MAG: TraM recognition domain-containing protein, partial [Candidatus Magasanikbacteria bacterium]|nr:TraM recognition domain-containing protein [Candidatus Magasanikbacteria bacterium]
NVAQVKSTINKREIIDSGKILLVNLSKGRIGEDNSRLLGGMMVTKIQLSAMERVDMPENERRDFFLYVDEFQNFATESFANILSEARKYRLSLVMAHQYVEQLSEEVAAAVFGNVGSLIAFRVGATDAETLEKEFEPHFLIEDFVNLPKYNMYLRLMIDGVASAPFSATTIPPIDARTGSMASVIDASRKNYGHSRAMIEEKIARWSGFTELVPVSGTSADTEEGVMNTGGASSEEYTPPPRSAPRQPREERPVEMIKVLPDSNPRRDINPRKERTQREELPMIVVKPDQSAPRSPLSGVSGGDDRRKRKRHRKKKDGQGGGQPSEGLREQQVAPRAVSEAPDVQDIVLGNPTEKGISLDALKQP